jgi:hypothetical protein
MLQQYITQSAYKLKPRRPLLMGSQFPLYLEEMQVDGKKYMYVSRKGLKQSGNPFLSR